MPNNAEIKSKGTHWLVYAAGMLPLVGYIFYRIWFLRVPKRNIPHNDNWFVSPAMGKIISIRKFDTEDVIEPKDNPLSERGAIHLLTKDVSPTGTIVTIMLQVTDAHYQRACTSGVIVSTKYTAGNKNNAVTMPSEQFSRYENEHNEILIKSQNKGILYKVVQIAGFVARQIECYVKPNQVVSQGRILGVINMGSQVSLVLPESVAIKVKVGDVVIDGETVIGTIN